MWAWFLLMRVYIVIGPIPFALPERIRAHARLRRGVRAAAPLTVAARPPAAEHTQSRQAMADAAWLSVADELFQRRMGHTATVWRDCVLIIGGRDGCARLLREHACATRVGGACGVC
jgi:hypothetical protein